MTRLDDLVIPQPPYRMKRPVAKLASVASFPASTPVLSPGPMPPPQAEIHEKLPQQETREQEVRRLVKEALDKLDVYRKDLP